MILMMERLEFEFDLITDLLDRRSFPVSSQEARVEHRDPKPTEEETEECKDPIQVPQRLETGADRDPRDEDQTEDEEAELELTRSLG